MRSAALAVLLGVTCFAPVALAQTPAQQGGPADLCRELLAFAEKKASEPPKQGQAATPGTASAPRVDAESSGTQGGGSVDGRASKDTSSQSSAPATMPVSSGAAPEAASSPHATSGQGNGEGGPSKEVFKLAGDVPLDQVRETAKRGDRQACRDLTQKVRRAGGDLPADLLALAAYEPDPARRK